VKEGERVWPQQLGFAVDVDSQTENGPDSTNGEVLLGLGPAPQPSSLASLGDADLPVRV
jgi:hypothetical protein